MELKVSILFTALCFTICNAYYYQNEDEITDLPGLPSKPSFKQYSGYLNATNNRYLHYWFVESAKDPANDPLLLWLNGGPGCSSMEGFLGEHGPFHVVPGTNKLYINDFSWNNVANVLYLEAPAGVGFSYSEDADYKHYDDDKVSLDNYVALQNFFKKYPQFKKNDFYVTGESYGGIYVPTLTVRVLTGQALVPIKLKGFAVGNGMSSYPLNDNSLIFFLYYHGLFGKTLWSALTTHCCADGVSQTTCNFHNNPDKDCQNAVTQANTILFSSGVNPYDLYDVCNTSALTSKRFETEIKHIFKSYKLNLNFKSKPSKSLHEDPPCIDDSDLANYLNQKSVRSALHIPSGVQEWTICSGEIGASYKTLYQNMTAQYNLLLPKVRGLVYNGDADMMCNYLGDQWFVDSLGRKIVKDYTNWKVDSQVGGFVKRFENLDFVTIRGAGHMVPTNKPKEALKMISSFLYKKPY